MREPSTYCSCRHFQYWSNRLGNMHICIRFFISKGTCVIHYSGEILWTSSSSEVFQYHGPLWTIGQEISPPPFRQMPIPEDFHIQSNENPTFAIFWEQQQKQLLAVQAHVIDKIRHWRTIRLSALVCTAVLIAGQCRSWWETGVVRLQSQF